jgi:lipopolysaccharide/colanic/teichoic acid biosynthesis glycosyltransferase
MIALDIQQVTRRSLRLDSSILLRTLPAVIRAAGAS